MTAVALRSTSTALRRLLFWAVVGAVAVGAVAGLTVESRGPAGDAANGRMTAERQSVARYREDLDPIIKEGATLVGQGLRPGFADIQSHEYPPAVLLEMAEGWVSTAERLRADLRLVRPPPQLAAAHRLYGRSLDGYVETARALRAAAGVEGEERASALAQAASLGHSADELYDRADAALTRAVGDDDPEPE